MGRIWSHFLIGKTCRWGRLRELGAIFDLHLNDAVDQIVCEVLRLTGLVVFARPEKDILVRTQNE